MNDSDTEQEMSTPGGIARYLSVYGAMWRNSVVREMSFKLNFILWIFVEMLWFAMQLVFINVLYLHTDRIGTWTKWEVILLMGVSHFIQQFFQAFFLTNITALSENIRTGKLDFMLLLPVNTRFLISLRQVDLGGFVNAATAFAVMVYAGIQLQLSPGIGQIAGFLLLVMVGVLIHYSLILILSCISFWTVRADGIVWGYYNLFNIARLPDDAFHGAFKAVFTFVIPMLVVSNVPAKVLINKLSSPFEWVQLVLLAIVIFLISEGVWRFSVKRYTSASS
jgi:ABC-2 type transport system permease protein